MDIINREHIITNKQLEMFIDMLGPAYRPARIIVYENRLDLFHYYSRCFNFSWEELLGQLEGSYDTTTDTVYLCIFAQNDDGDDLHSKQLYSLHALAHELRHRYQEVKNLFQGEDEKSERDADQFATRTINRNSRCISNIMGWAEEWTVEEEDRP